MLPLAVRFAIPVAALLLAAPAVQASHPGRGYGGAIVCESHDGRDRYCRVDTRGGVWLVQQRSRAACIEGRTWGWDRGGIWVGHGCRGEFAVGGRGYGPPPWGPPHGAPGYGWPGGPLLIRCESHDGRYAVCTLPRGYRDAVVTRQFSRSPCDYGYSWGLQRGAIWVDRGCRAEFRVY